MGKKCSALYRESSFFYPSEFGLLLRVMSYLVLEVSRQKLRNSHLAG